MKTRIETLCVQGTYQPKNGDPRVLPLVESTTYVYDTSAELAHLFDVPKDGHIYSRITNPTVAAFESKIAALEGGMAGMAASSGMAAELMTVFTVCSTGDNFLCASTIYGGSVNLFSKTLLKMGVEARFFNPEASDKEISSLIDSKTKLLFAETIANPNMNILDFEKMSRICKQHKLLFAVDNTLATPVLTRPIEFGANIVVHSTTKYLDGHAGVVGGLIIDAGNFEFRGNPRYRDFNEPDESYHGVIYVDEGGPLAFILKARYQLMRDFGACMQPATAKLLYTHTETLHLRMERHSENALKCARALKANKNVAWVKYPALEGDSENERAKKYMPDGSSGMLTFGLKGGKAAAEKFISNIKLIKQVTHIADVRSCVLHPASTTHRQLSEKALEQAGIGQDLIRLSVGIENAIDIIADLEEAINKSV